MKSARVFWDKAAPRYAKSPVKDEETYRKKLSITRSYLQRDWSVLEFGCGTGSTAIQHAAHVGRILATDVSPRMLEIAEGKVREAGITNIRFQEGSLDSLKLMPSSFDAVLGLNILHLLEEVPGAVSRVYEVLKPGGVFVSSTALVAEMAWYWRGTIPVMQRLGLAPHVSPLSQKGLVALLTDAGFYIDHEWRVTRESVFIVAGKPLP